MARGGGPLPLVKQLVYVQTGAVATGTTPIPLDDSIPLITEGDEYMTLPVTPKLGGSTLKIDVACLLSNSAGTRTLIAALFKNAGANALAVGAHFMANGTGIVMVTISYAEPSVSVASRTYRVRAGGDLAGTTTFNGHVGARRFGGAVISSISIMEYMP